MATVQGEASGNVNYYNTASVEIPLNTTGFAAGANFTFTLEVLQYTGTDQIGYDVYFERPAPDTQNCFHWSGITPSGNPTATVTQQFGPPGSGVEWTGTSQATGCLDFTRAILVIRNFGYPGSWFLDVRLTIGFVPGTLPAGNCQYGTRLKAGTPVTVITSPAYVSTVLSAIGAPWAVQAFASVYYQFLDLNALCGSGPPIGVTIDMSTWVSSAESIWKTFQWASWYYACECTPGTPPPTPFPPPVLTQPTSWPTDPGTSCDPAVICDALNLIQRQLQVLTSAVGRDYQLDTLMQRYQLPMAAIAGAVHSGLSGSGAFNISRLIGIQYTITAGLDGKPVLPGNPSYIKDLGWISVSELNGMILERRVTRLNERWLPQHCALADKFGYYFAPGVVADVVELEAEP